MEAPLYDRIGSGYSATRRTEPRIATRIEAALGTAETVVNVGAGTGCYEPPGRRVTAVPPSAVMIGQRPPDAAPSGAVQRRPTQAGGTRCGRLRTLRRARPRLPAGGG